MAEHDISFSASALDVYILMTLADILFHGGYWIIEPKPLQYFLNDVHSGLIVYDEYPPLMGREEGWDIELWRDIAKLCQSISSLIEKHLGGGVGDSTDHGGER